MMGEEELTIKGLVAADEEVSQTTVFELDSIAISFILRSERFVYEPEARICGYPQKIEHVPPRFTLEILTTMPA
jgi:hypothetical protein